MKINKHSELVDNALLWMGDKEYIKENMDDIIKRIKKMTQINYTKSIIILASEILKNKKMVAALESLNTIRDFFGSVKGGDIRNEILEIAFNSAKKILSKEDYKKLYDAFNGIITISRTVP